ncbi:MAG TPA: helix-turn-helix transcriptional regulator [Patescibacteria group bacterium]|nr:helix-turn-helix transcriptional regulator [Patescibacteria group bacterium]
MIIGERIRTLRELKGLSQGDIEKRSGLLRCYISRVENGHTSPSLETLEKFSRGLEVPLHELFYEGEEAPVLSSLTAEDITLQPNSGPSLHRLAELFRGLGQQDRQIVLQTAERLSKI